MCKFCEGYSAINDIPVDESKDRCRITLYMKNKDLILNYDAFFCDSSINDEVLACINYCPLCGIKL